MELDAKERITEHIDPSHGIEDEMDRMIREDERTAETKATRDQIASMREHYATGEEVKEARFSITGRDYVRKSDDEFERVTEQDSHTLVGRDTGTVYIRDVDGNFKEAEE